MAKTLQELDALLKLVGDEDLDTLRLIERELHALVERKARNESMARENGGEQETVSKLWAKVTIDPELLALVGIQPENPVEDDKALIRDAVARRLSD